MLNIAYAEKIEQLEKAVLVNSEIKRKGVELGSDDRSNALELAKIRKKIRAKCRWCDYHYLVEETENLANN